MNLNVNANILKFNIYLTIVSICKCWNIRFRSLGDDDYLNFAQHKIYLNSFIYIYINSTIYG